MSDNWESGGPPDERPGQAQWPPGEPESPGLWRRIRSAHIAVKLTGLAITIALGLFGIGAAANFSDCGALTCDDGDDAAAVADDTPRATAGASTRAPTRDQPTPPQDAPSTVEPTVPSPTNTPEPTPTVHAVIGTTIEAKGSRYTVNAVRDPFTPDATFFQPTPGARWMAVDITQEGVAESDDFNPFYFFVQDANDYVYSYQFLAAPEPRMDSGQLLAGQRTRGWVGFEVPVDAVIISVLTQPEPLGPKIVIADLR